MGRRRGAGIKNEPPERTRRLAFFVPLLQAAGLSAIYGNSGSPTVVWLPEASCCGLKSASDGFSPIPSDARIFCETAGINGYTAAAIRRRASSVV